MAQADRNMSPPSNPQVANLSKTTSRSSPSPFRHQPLGRAATFADGYPALRKRRSSTFSESAQSLKSSTDDLLLPRAKSSEEITHHEDSHWESVPLVLALLPAVGGLIFHNGGAVVTDISLLALAAIFLNWSVRLPWDWYRASQAVLVDETPSQRLSRDHDDIIEEEDEDEVTHKDPPASPGGNAERAHDQKESTAVNRRSEGHASAAGELRIHELLALLACFVGPVIGAWLLHHIRDQLSRPSEGLVSNYNLTIFLLASEVRPLSHLIKLVQARTLYLQRIVASNPYQSSNPPDTLNDLASRISELETNQKNNSQPQSPTATHQQQSDLITATRKSLQPDLDALNRAVRRYEKRATLLTMQTEARLQDLEKKLSDAITLAAAAERSSQASKQRRGSGMIVILDGLSRAALLPVQVAWTVVSLPGRMLGGAVSWVEDVVGMRIRREMRTAGKSEGKVSGDGERRRVGRGQKKQS